MNDIYPIDIWHVIFHHCDLLSQLKLIIVCSDFYHSFYITDIYNIPEGYENKLTGIVLQQRKFSRLIQLNIRFNENINDVSFMTSLKKPKVHPMGRIDQQGINGLNLIELDISYNDTIKDISFMTNLKKLRVSYFCGIDQHGIKGLNLIELDVS